jgi:predicted DNA-binding transcriptional regulator AlpA
MTRPKLLRIVDIAEILGVSKQRAHQIADEKGFPRPRHLPDGTRVWRADVIERWPERRWWGQKPWRQPGWGTDQATAGRG